MVLGSCFMYFFRFCILVAGFAYGGLPLGLSLCAIMGIREVYLALLGDTERTNQNVLLGLSVLFLAAEVAAYATAFYVAS